MNKTLATLIVEACDAAGVEGVTMSETYSGRCMYGKTTAAIITEQYTSIVQAMGALTIFALDNPDRFDDLGLEYLISEFRSDNMGLGMVYY